MEQGKFVQQNDLLIGAFHCIDVYVCTRLLGYRQTRQIGDPDISIPNLVNSK